MTEENDASSAAEPVSVVPLAGPESRRWWRTRWLVAVVIGAVLMVGGVFYEADERDGFAQFYADVFHGGVRGPYGSFPPSPPVRPSLRSLRATATGGIDTTGFFGAVSVPSVVYDGISVSSDGDDVVKAVVRSGKTYWRYQRHNQAISSIALDKKRGELFLSWGPPWRASGNKKTSIEMMDVRSGRVRWRRSVGLAPVWSANGPKSRYTRMAVDDAGRVVVLGDHGMAGLDGGTGRVRWTTLWPSGCDSLDTVIRDNPVVVSGTAAFKLTCQVTAPAVGYDTATGARRWRLDFETLLSKSPDYVSLADFVHFSDLGGGLLAIWGRRVTVVTDPTSGRIIRDVSTADQSEAGAPAEGFRVGNCGPAARLWRLCATDLRTGRSLWRTRLPLDHPAGVAIDHDRVYMLSKDVTGPWQLSVFDLHTGARLERAPMSNLPNSLKLSTPQSYELVRATDGVLTIVIHTAPWVSGDGTTFSLVA